MMRSISLRGSVSRRSSSRSSWIWQKSKRKSS